MNTLSIHSSEPLLSSVCASALPVTVNTGIIITFHESICLHFNLCWLHTTSETDLAAGWVSDALLIHKPPSFLIKFSIAVQAFVKPDTQLRGDATAPRLVE